MLRAYCDGGKLHAGNTLRQLDLHARRRGAASLHHIAVVIASDSSTCLHVAEAMLWNTMLEELPFSSAERAAMNAAELSQALPFPSIDRPRRLVGALDGWWDGAGAERRLRDQVGAAECRLCAIRDYYACQLHSRKPLIAWTRAAPRWPQTRGPTSTCHTRAPIHQRGGTTQAAARAVLWPSCGTWPRRSCRAVYEESLVHHVDLRFETCLCTLSFWSHNPRELEFGRSSGGLRVQEPTFEDTDDLWGSTRVGSANPYIRSRWAEDFAIMWRGIRSCGVETAHGELAGGETVIK